MKRASAIALILLGVPAFAHRLDEYLQATIISVEKDHVDGFMRLVPGVAVSAAVLATIDTNRDGILSATEQQTYAQRVLRDLSLSADGRHLQPRLVSVQFPQSEQIKEGLGEIQIAFTAKLTDGPRDRTLMLENRHDSQISAYLVNCLVPRDKHIRIAAQNRSADQSLYQLNYVQADDRPGWQSFGGWSGIRGMPGDLGVLPSTYRLGVRHIAEGTDHLLFLLALLLPAPLLAARSRWAGFAPVRHAFLQILRVVTAFTMGHSITLALAAWGLVHMSSRPIEVLIAVSILISAIHALRPLFPGREAVIAAFFGLVHGLAFATTLADLGLRRWERVAGILGFNLGIESMQLVVVAATIPSLVLLSRTPAYSFLRIGGALFAGSASLGWIVERLLEKHTAVDFLVGRLAHYAAWVAGVLFLTSLACWAFQQRPRIRPSMSSIAGLSTLQSDSTI